MREVSLSEEEVEDLMSQIEAKLDETHKDDYEFFDDTFENGLQNVFSETERQGVDMESFDIYQKASHLITDTEEITKGASGQYNSFSRKISKRTSGADILGPSFEMTELAVEGYMQDYITIHHEYLHHLQYSRSVESEKKIILLLKRIVSILSGIFKPRRLLGEIHSNEGSNRFGSRQSNREYFDSMRSDLYNLIKNKKDIRMMLVGIFQVKALYALGLSDQEIGELVQKAKWDKTNRTFISLKEKIDEIMTSRNISNDQLKKLIEEEDIETQIHAEKIKKIAQEELKNILKNLEK